MKALIVDGHAAFLDAKGKTRQDDMSIHRWIVIDARADGCLEIAAAHTYSDIVWAVPQPTPDGLEPPWEPLDLDRAVTLKSLLWSRLRGSPQAWIDL